MRFRLWPILLAFAAGMFWSISRARAALRNDAPELAALAH